MQLVRIGLALALAAALGGHALAGAESTPRAPSPNRIEAQAVNLRNSNGTFRCAFFNSPDGFPKDSHKAVAEVRTPIVGGQASCIVDGLPPGSYAIATLHDEDDNGHMEFGLLGIPLKGYGFSSDPTVYLKAPSFDAAKFDYRGGALVVPIRIHYWGKAPASAVSPAP